MPTAVHVVLCQLLALFSLIVAPLFFCAASGSLPDVLVVFAIYALLSLATWDWIPVRCHTPGCTGRMRRTASQISFFKTRLHYRCRVCAVAYEADIFAPDITIEVSG